MQEKSPIAAKRKRPTRLAEKLLEIRTKLGLSQGGMVRFLGLEAELERDYISKYERNILEPTLETLLMYARAISTTGGGEFLEVLIDDKMDLPKSIPADPNKEIPAQRKNIKRVLKPHSELRAKG